MLISIIKKNSFKLFAGTSLLLVFLPFSREPIQADDLSGYASVIQINGNLGVLAGFQNWIALQFETTSHFLPFGWTFQWIQYTFVDFVSKSLNAGFILTWTSANLLIISLLSYFTIRNFVSGLSKFANQNDPLMIDKKCAYVSLLLASLVTIHSPWSIEPFASHLAYGLLTTFLFSLIYLFTTEMISRNCQNQTNKIAIKFAIVSTLGLCTYDLFISLLFISSILAILYLKLTGPSLEKRNFKNLTLLFFGVVYPLLFFIFTRKINQVPEYEGTKLLINTQNVKAVFFGIASTFQPTGTFKAIQVFNAPITLHLSGILISLLLIIQVQVFMRFAHTPTLPRLTTGYYLYSTCYFVTLSFVVVATQVFNERWGVYIAQIGNIYLFYSTTLLLAVCLIGFLSYEFLAETQPKILHIGVTSILLVSVIVSTNTNWTVLKRDVRNPGTDLIALAYDISTTELERCTAEKKFLEIGYPESYSGNVLNSVRSFGNRNIGAEFCRFSDVKGK